jgi:MFS family permease
MDTTLKKSNYPWVIVFTALFWSGLIFGLMVNTVGLFFSPVATEMGWTMKQATLFMSIFPIVAGITSPFAGKIFQKYKTNVVLSIIAFVLCATYVWSSTFTALWQWNFYGVITGICGGFLMYIPIPMLINNWFTKSKGIALGIAAAFVNFVPAIGNPIVTAQIAAHGWRPVRVVVGIVLAVVVIPVTMIFVRQFPKDKNTVAWGEGEGANGAAAQSAVKTGVSVANATKSPAFWLSLLAVACLVSCATINQRIASLATARGFDAVAIGMASSIIMVGAILGKFILGFIRDKSGNAILTGLTCAGFGLVGCLIFLTVGTTGVAIFYVSILIYGFGYAGLTVVPPMVVEAAFGGKNFGQIYANVSIATCVASSITSYIYAAIIDATGGYDGCFILAMGFYAVFALCVPMIVKIGQKLPRESA